MNLKQELQLSPKTLAPCPFCGFELELGEDPDVLYPLNNTFDLWNIVCPASSGGCDTSILAGSASEAIDKWNTRSKRAAEVVIELNNSEGKFQLKITA